MAAFAVVLYLCFCTHGSAAVNGWTSPVSARWEEPYWSLNKLPASDQHVMVTNDGLKAVGVWPSTVQNYASCLVTSNLHISAPPGSLSTVLLNYSGSGVPLRVRNALSIGTNGALMNLYSGLQVEGIGGGAFQIRGGRLAQESGTTVATNVRTVIVNGEASVTNAFLRLGDLCLGEASSPPGRFLQNGGAVSAARLAVTNGTYTLQAGTLLSGSSAITGLEPHSSTFEHVAGTNSGPVSLLGLLSSYRLRGGTVRASAIAVMNHAKWLQGGGVVMSLSNTLGGPYASSPQGYFYLSNGIVRCQSWNMLNGVFSHSDGEHTVTNSLRLAGYYRDDRGWITSNQPQYLLSGGNLDCGSLRLEYFGFVHQSGGTGRIYGNLSVADTAYTLSAGTLSNANVFLNPSNTSFASSLFDQTGGNHTISSLLSINNNGRWFDSTYRLSGGSLAVPTIVMQGRNGILAISNSPVVNNRLLDFAGGTLLAGGSAQFGQILVRSNSLLAFGNAPASISLQESTGIAWPGEGTLMISNWTAGVHHVYIGSNSNSLSASQLARIGFINPVGRLKGSYPATLLRTGEIAISPENSVLVGGWPEGTPDPGNASYWEAKVMYPEPSTNVVAISAGWPNLALRADGTIRTWGPDGLPIPPEINSGMVAIASGGFHSLALRSNGTVAAWGYQYDGTRTNVPAGLSDVVAISAGDHVSLALRSDGSIVAWGENIAGLTNIPAAAMPAIAVSCGAGHALALKADGSVIGWGQSDYGEAQPPPGLTNVVAIEAGYSMSMALKANGTVIAWGANWAGQIDVPPGLSNVVAISAGHSHALALKADGSLVAWGSTDQSTHSAAPPWLTNVRAVSAGGGYSLVLLHGGAYNRVPAANPSRIGNQFSVQIPTRSGRVYGLEWTTDVNSTHWALSFPLVAGRLGTVTLTDRSAVQGRKFYRVREW